MSAFTLLCVLLAVCAVARAAKVVDAATASSAISRQQQQQQQQQDESLSDAAEHDDNAEDEAEATPTPRQPSFFYPPFVNARGVARVSYDAVIPVSSNYEVPGTVTGNAAASVYETRQRSMNGANGTASEVVVFLNSTSAADSYFLTDENAPPNDYVCRNLTGKGLALFQTYAFQNLVAPCANGVYVGKALYTYRAFTLNNVRLAHVWSGCVMPVSPMRIPLAQQNVTVYADPVTARPIAMIAHKNGQPSLIQEFTAFTDTIYGVEYPPYTALC